MPSYCKELNHELSIMKRRRLLQGAAGLFAAQYLPISGVVRSTRAALPALRHPVLANVMLVGGPDFRYLFPPAFTSDPNSYGFKFYEARAKALKIGSTADAFANVWQTKYSHVAAGSTQFGILSSCDWLTSMWNAGHVALVANVVGAESRDHAHAQLVWESADRSLQQTDKPGTGWGGRLADVANSQVLSLSPAPRPFCFGADAADARTPSSDRVVTLASPDSVGLFQPAPTDDATAIGISQALRQYYAASRNDIAALAPQRRFVNTQKTLSDLGERLRTVFTALQQPAEISGLLGGPNALVNKSLAVQMRNVFYALAASGEVDFHTLSLVFGGFDTHDMEQEEVEPKYRDMFRSGGAMDVLYRLLPDSITSRLVFMFSGEFGRQLRANGDTGTDHGRGNSVLLVGYPVRGGAYGELFPLAELDRLNDPSPDIIGLTHIDSVLAPLVEYLHPGSARTVLHGLDTAQTEAGVSLVDLFSA